VLDVENGEQLQRLQLATGPIVCLAWAEEAAGSAGRAGPDSLLRADGAARFCGAPAGLLPVPGRPPPPVRAPLYSAT